ncbi:MAG: Chromosome partition protein Smc [Mycoplasmataceae bacterium]|nr:MAG: Chromosome partition protein Smc [Mycoplasmataceae bacterium]
MTDIQQRLDKNYPNKEIKLLNLSEKDLEGNLDLSQFANLEELNCSHNLLDNLDLSQCPNLTKLDCSYNILDNLNFLTKLPNPEKLIEVNLTECGADQEEIITVLNTLNLENPIKDRTTINPIIFQVQELTTKITDLEKENKSLQEQLDKIKLSLNKEEINWQSVINSEQRLQENIIEEKQFYQERADLEDKIDSLNKQIEEKEEELKKLSTSNQEEKEKLERELAEVRQKKIELEKQLKDKNEQITNLQEESKENIDELRSSINKLNKQIKKIIIQKIELEKKLSKGLSKTLEIRKKELTNFIKKCLDSIILIKKSKREKEINELLKKQWQVIENKNQKLVESLDEELTRLKKKVSDFIGLEKCKKLCLLKQEIINLEIEQEELDQSVTSVADFLQKEANPFALSITEKEQKLENLVKKAKDKLGKDDEAKKILDNWMSKEDCDEKLRDILKGRGLTEEKRKELDNLKEELLKLKNKSLLWETKKIFLNIRQITIKGLQNCYNKLKGDKKYVMADEVGNLINALGGVSDSLTFGIPNALGEVIKSINASFRKKFSDEIEKKFSELLNNDRDNLIILEKEINNDKLFSNNKYQIFGIDNSVWEDKIFNSLEDMEKFIIVLSENLKELQKELDQESKQLKESNIQEAQVVQLDIRN